MSRSAQQRKCLIGALPECIYGSIRPDSLRLIPAEVSEPIRRKLYYNGLGERRSIEISSVYRRVLSWGGHGEREYGRVRSSRRCVGTVEANG